MVPYRVGSPAVVLLSEQLVRAILRVNTLVSSTVQAARRLSADLAADLGVTRASAASSSDVQAGTDGGTAAAAGRPPVAQPAITIQNKCPAEMLLAQAGTSRQLMLPSGGCLSFTWAASGEQMLGIAAAPEDTHLKAGSAAKGGSAREPGAAGRDAQQAPVWCLPVDIMTAGCCRRQLQCAGGMTAELAVVCKSERHQWVVQLLPPLVLAARATPVQICLVGWQARNLSQAKAAAEPAMEAFDLTNAQVSLWPVQSTATHRALLRSRFFGMPPSSGADSLMHAGRT